MIDHTINRMLPKQVARSSFVLGAFWVLLLSVFVDVGMASIPFSKMDTLLGHLRMLTFDQWFTCIFSLANLFRIAGVTILGLYLSGKWSRQVWVLYTVIPLIPVLAGGLFLNTEYFAIILMPWFLIIAFFMTPVFLVDLLFRQIDGEFFVDGPGWLLQVGSWLIFCLCCWIVHFKSKRKALHECTREA